MKTIGPKRPRAVVDKALEVGSKAHYDDPAYYNKAYAGRLDDVEFYRRLARKYAGPVLEYGMGNGRIAIPMAEQGVTVTGIDLSKPMLDDLGRRLETQPAEIQRRITAVHGDMRETKLSRKFPLVICTFNTFLHLYTREDVESFLACVAHHLSPDGVFVFDVAVPQPGDLDRDPNRTYSSPRMRHPTTKQLVKYAERFDYDCARQVLFVTMEFTPVDGSPSWVVPLAHRQFFPQELEALLHYNGFIVNDVRGGFEQEPLSRYSDVSVWTCRRRS